MLYIYIYLISINIYKYTFIYIYIICIYIYIIWNCHYKRVTFIFNRKLWILTIYWLYILLYIDICCICLRYIIYIGSMVQTQTYKNKHIPICLENTEWRNKMVFRTLPKAPLRWSLPFATISAEVCLLS